ncbi:MAG: hypothetical protein UT05_C0017G0003 [Parcubacteria group bacterium GW2011_GWF2_38_76]|nr:MAG: hypothetical protein UT05_C0017G0003 [Parcubacteria group bacterium GW2011_GWF2_38_76]
MGIYYYFFLKTPISCSDGKKNQGELDIDCGGPCSEICESEILPLSVEWVRPFKLLNGKYDVAAMVVNRNTTFGIPSFNYKFSVFDDKNVNVTDKNGSVFINPNEKVLLFISGLDSGQRSVSKAFLEYNKDKKEEGWLRVGDISDKPRLSVENEKVVEGNTPRLYADIINSSPYDLRNIEVSAIVYDEQDNAMAVSRTMIDFLIKDSREQVVFTWPSPFNFKWKRIDILPRIDYVTKNN